MSVLHVLSINLVLESFFDFLCALLCIPRCPAPWTAHCQLAPICIQPVGDMGKLGAARIKRFSKMCFWQGFEFLHNSSFFSVLLVYKFQFHCCSNGISILLIPKVVDFLNAADFLHLSLILEFSNPLNPLFIKVSYIIWVWFWNLDCNNECSTHYTYYMGFFNHSKHSFQVLIVDETLHKQCLSEEDQ